MLTSLFLCAACLVQTPDVVEDFVVRNQGVRITATATRPPGEGPFPTMIVIGHGQGMTRSGVGTELHGYRGLGLAVVTYDRRGYGASEGSKDATFELSASDVRVLIDHVLELPWVDHAALGLSARSRGAWIAPLVARDDPRVRFVVALVPPVRSAAQIVVTSHLDKLARTGRSREELALAGRALEALCEHARGRLDWSAYDAIRHEAATHPWAALLELPDSQDNAIWPWLAHDGDYDPFPQWRFVRQPVLGIFAGEDLDVEPKANAALPTAACPDATVEIRPGIGHELEPVAPREGGARGPDPGVWDSVGDWLSKRDLLPLH